MPKKSKKVRGIICRIQEAEEGLQEPIVDGPDYLPGATPNGPWPPEPPEAQDPAEIPFTAGLEAGEGGQRPLFGDHDIIVNALEMEEKDIQAEIDRDYDRIHRIQREIEGLTARLELVHRANVRAKLLGEAGNLRNVPATQPLDENPTLPAPEEAPTPQPEDQQAPGPQPDDPAPVMDRMAVPERKARKARKPKVQPEEPAK